MDKITILDIHPADCGKLKCKASVGEYMDTENKLSSDVSGEKNGVRPKAEYGDGIYYYELTPAQKNIDDLQRFYSGTSISNLCGAVIFEEKLDKDRIMRALGTVIRRHEALRLRFRIVNGKTVQYISGEYREVFDFKEFPSYDMMREYCTRQAEIPFEMSGGEMYRISVFALPDRSGIMLCASHLIADAWTFSILARDIYEIYKQCGKSSSAGKYTDCIRKNRLYLSTPKYEKDRIYWSEKYSGGVEETPVRHTRKADSGISARRYITVMPRKLSMAAEMFCKENSVSVAALFESAMLLYLSEINGRNTVTIGISVLGRGSIYEKKTAGMFISSMPLTVQLYDNESVSDFCKRTFNAHNEIYRHSRLPYCDIIRGIRENSGFGGRLFDVLLSCQNAVTDINASTEWFSNGYSEVPLAFHIDDRDENGSFGITIDYQTDVFSGEKEIELLIQRILHIIRQVTADGDKIIKDISVLPPTEYNLLIHSFNNTSAEYQRNKCVHEAFSEAAASHPDKTALIFHGREYTYSELDKMSDALAYFLHDRGICRNDIVPLAAKRSPYVIIAMLAVLKAGGAYMPISPDNPGQRTEYMIKNAGAKFVLTYGCTCRTVSEIKLEKFDYTYGKQIPLEKSFPDDLCYIIYTSGSTGNPKGVAVTHRNVMNYCSGNEFNIFGKIIKAGTKSIVSVTNIVFDIFVTESILALLNGIVIVLADDEQAVSQKALGKLISDTRAEVIQTTPTKMRSFLFDKNNLKFLSCLNTIILGGEEMSASLCHELKKYTDADIYNVYGPAETTVWSSSAAVCENDISIGKPAANTRIYILNDKREPVPVGIMGEICISGDGVSKGYINSPALTDRKFFPDPFFGGDTVYSTGDMGIVRADGNIEFCGRRDNQIKLRGLRIEPGEIECAMSRFEGIEAAAVLCKKTSAGEQYLAGCYTSVQAIDESDLRRFMLGILPSYMIPNVFVRIKCMPMTKSGKIDRKAISQADMPVRAEHKYTAPTNEREKQLCSVMAKVLNIPCAGTDDDFFLLGGDSFSAMEFVALAEDKGYSFSVKNIYEYRTVRKLCKIIGENKKTSSYVRDYSRYPMKRTNSDLRYFRIFSSLTKKFYNFEVSGLENIDTSQKYIICPNHESDLDCMWVWAALGKIADINSTCALIAKEHLNKSLSRRIFRISGGIPVDRSGDFMPSLKRAAAVLKRHKRMLLVHPEGTRTRNGKLGKFKKGAAIISMKTGVKIIPVYISGAREIFPVTRKIPKLFNIKGMKKFPLRIIFGMPVDPVGKTAEQITDEMYAQILNMKRKTLR